MRYRTACLRWVVVVSGLTARDGFSADLPPTTKPANTEARSATQPSVDTLTQNLVEASIQQLGDDPFARRERAAELLRKLGKESLPALEKRKDDPDPQVRTSVRELITEINRPSQRTSPDATDPLANANPLQQPRLLRPFPGPGNGQFHIMMRVEKNTNSTKDVSINENGHKVHIHQDTDGIKMEVTDNGHTTEYKTKDANDLKLNQPEAFKLYEQYCGGENQIQIQPVKP